MKKKRNIIFILSFLFIIFCGQDVIKSPVKVEIVALEKGIYKRKTVELETVIDLTKAKGKYFFFLGAAKINAEYEYDEVSFVPNLDEIYFDKGKSFRLNIKKAGDIYLANNFETMCVLTMFYNLENILSYWQKNTNYIADENQPIRIVYDPIFVSKDSEKELFLQLKLNAVYLTGYNNLWFFKTSSIEEIPLKMNLSVLAHEFMHVVFDKNFSKGDLSFYETQEKKNTYRLNAINEGLADHSAWAISQDLSGYSSSLGDFDERELPAKFTNKDLKSSFNHAGCKGGFYCEGSVVASFLLDLTLEHSISQETVSSWVFEAILNLREDWQATKDVGSFDFYYLLKRINDQAGPENKAKVCQSFRKWFDDTINIKKAEEYCL